MVCHILFLYLNTYVWSLQRIQKQLYGELPISPLLNKEFLAQESSEESGSESKAKQQKKLSSPQQKSDPDPTS